MATQVTQGEGVEYIFLPGDLVDFRRGNTHLRIRGVIVSDPFAGENNVTCYTVMDRDLVMWTVEALADGLWFEDFEQVRSRVADGRELDIRDD